MVVYKASDLAAVTKQTLSKGNQIKYLAGAKWIKWDTLGYESLVEVLASQICEQLNFDHVDYQLCQITDGYSCKNACISEDFSQGLVEVSLGSLIEQLTGYIIDLSRYHSIADRVLAVYEPLQDLIEYDVFLQYLNKLISLDAVLFNEDRHLYNIGFLVDESSLKPAPIFDCGAGLLSDSSIDYPFEMPIEVCLRRIKAKPFSTSFRKQVHFFNTLCECPFSVKSVSIDLADLENVYSVKVLNRALNVLKVGLQFFNVELKFKMDKPGMHTSVFNPA